MILLYTSRKDILGYNETMIYSGFNLQQDSVDLFGGYCNCYILETKHFIYIIDTNIERARLLLDEELQKLPLNEKRIRVLLTHQHWDHVALAGYLKDKYHAEIIAPRNSSQMLYDKEVQLKELYDHFAPRYPFADGVKAIFDKEFTYPCKPDITVEGGDVFYDDNFTLKVINTAGHCNDQLSFYNPENRLLFCGDSIQGRGYNRHPALYEDATALRKTLQQIMELKPKTLYGGHFVIAEPDSCRRYIQQSLDFIDEIDAFIKENPVSFDELVNRFCQNYGYEYSMHVICTLNAHTHEFKNPIL